MPELKIWRPQRQAAIDPKRTVDAGVSTDRIDDGCADCMLRRQSHDIGAPQVLLEMAVAAEQAARHLGRVLAPMRAFLSAHRTIEDLLDPSLR
jgi:hypothetical protein